MLGMETNRPGGSLTSKVLLFVILSYLVLTIFLLLLWNFGISWLGVQGRVPELMRREKDTIAESLVDKQLRSETWLSARLDEARTFSRFESPNPRLDILSSVKGPESTLNAEWQYFKTKYRLAVESSHTISRILVLRREDGVILVDSRGLDTGSVFLLPPAAKAKDLGQFRKQNEIYSFSAGLSSSGIPILFILVAPMKPLLDDLRNDRFDIVNGLGSALVDGRGKLLYSLFIPETKLRFAAGEVPVERTELAWMVAERKLFTALHGSYLISAGAAVVAISADEELFIVTSASQNRIIGAMVRESSVMALLTFLMAMATSLFALRYIRSILSPLGRLHVAVKAFGRSSSIQLPEDAPGEIGEITRAFSNLLDRVEAWKRDFEAELEVRTRMHRLTAELCGIYARDASEKANVEAANLLKDSFKAEAAALFYENAERQFRLCLAGTDLPIALSEEQWRSGIKPHYGEREVAYFGPWAPPGLDAPLPLWMSSRLYSSEGEGGYIFLGKTGDGWNKADEADLATVVRAIAPIVQVRREREIEEQERREAEGKLLSNERRLMTFLEGSRDMIYTVDSDDIVTWINAAGLTILGYFDKKEIIGKPFPSFAVNPNDGEQLFSQVREAGYVADFEIVLRRKDGTSVFCLETANAIRNPDREIIELQGIVKDITERIASEQTLWKTNIELADANLKILKTQSLMVQHEKLASIGQLASGVAHEINNPLGFLKSNHEMLVKYITAIRNAWEEAKAAPQANFLEIERRRKLPYLFSEIDMIFQESSDGFERIMHIVSNLKSFSRVEQNADFGSYDVNAGIESTLIMARNEIKYVADVKKVLGELPDIKARGNEINQVILNILVNAAQAIESQKRKEKGLIEIHTSALSDRVMITIRDDGPGIPDSIRQKIFDPFFTTKEPGKGTGLGLSISYDIIVTKHGGQLIVDSEVGRGTTFIIELLIAGPSTTISGNFP